MREMGKKTMIEFIRDYWELALTIVLGSVWIGRLSQRVSGIEHEVDELKTLEPGMSVLACGKQTLHCQSLQTKEFHEIKELLKNTSLSNQEFIKEVNKSNQQMIRDACLRSDDQHKLVMSHLLNGSKTVKD